MKKIAIASAAMGGAALVAFGASGTFAAFSDSGSTEGSAGAGTLVVSTSKTIATEAQSLTLAPGEQTRMTFPVQNGGSVDGLLSAVGTVVEAVDECDSTSESALPDDCKGGAGDFAVTALVDTYQVDVERPSDCNATTSIQGATNITAGYTLSRLHGAGVFGQPLAAGDTTCFILVVSLDERVGNVVQGDSATLSVGVTVEQDVAPAPA